MIGLAPTSLSATSCRTTRSSPPKAIRLIESLRVEVPGYVSVVTVVELVWVLTECYASTKDEVCEVLETLLRTKEITVAQTDTVWKAIRLFKSDKADFADCLIERSAAEAGCSHTATFDRKAVTGCGMRLID